MEAAPENICAEPGLCKGWELKQAIARQINKGWIYCQAGAVLFLTPWMILHCGADLLDVLTYVLVVVYPDP